MNEIHTAVVRASANTLRQVAEWGQMSRDELRDIAGQVERVDPDDLCCPLCEEVACDEGCALEQVRGEVA